MIYAACGLVVLQTALGVAAISTSGSVAVVLVTCQIVCAAAFLWLVIYAVLEGDRS